MNTSTTATHWARAVVTALLLSPAVVVAGHGSGVHASEAASVALRPDELDDLVGPIALYPDNMAAVALAASTFPLQVVEAANFLERARAEPGLQPGTDLHRAIVALLDYPQAVDLLNRDLVWSRRLGEAVLTQKDDVLDAVDGYRERAVAAGDLFTDAERVVSREGGRIKIVAAEQLVTGPPSYGPPVTVLYEPAPIVRYYDLPPPRHVDPYLSHSSFRLQFFHGPSRRFAAGRGHHGGHRMGHRSGAHRGRTGRGGPPRHHRR